MPVCQYEKRQRCNVAHLFRGLCARLLTDEFEYRCQVSGLMDVYLVDKQIYGFVDEWIVNESIDGSVDWWISGFVDQLNLLITKSGLVNSWNLGLVYW